jgi:hypothetical protein
MMARMGIHSISAAFLGNAWDVLVLFLIPIGGGIPAGVVLAQKRGFAWPLMAALYFISDVILALIFEPLMLQFLKASKNSPRLAKLREAMAQSTAKSVGRMGIRPGHLTLVWITFGTDPMTGRSVAKAAGHGFLMGWTLTIIGDMMFFLVLMASTLWLNNILGDGTWTAILITVAMIGIPPLVRKIRQHMGWVRPEGA